MAVLPTMFGAGTRSLVRVNVLKECVRTIHDAADADSVKEGHRDGVKHHIGRSIINIMNRKSSPRSQIITDIANH